MNYVGLCMFSGISMSFIIGGSNWNPRIAGWGGLIGGFIFAGLLVLLAFGLLFRVEDVASADLPTLALINQINPAFGTFSAIIIYLMIFATTLGVFYASGKRLAPDDEHGTSVKKYRITFTVLTLAGFGLSFFDFTLLVNNVLPVLGWLGVLLVIVLIATWLTRWRGRINDEARRRTRVAELVSRKLDPAEEFTQDDYVELVQETRGASVPADDLRDDVTEYVIAQLDVEDDLAADDVWSDSRFRKLMPGEVRVVSSAAPVAAGQPWEAEQLDDSWNVSAPEAEVEDGHE